MVKKIPFTAIIFFLLLTPSFKVNTKLRWDVSREDPTIWLKVDVDHLTSGFNSTEMEDGTDLVGDLASEKQRIELIQQVIDDYNDTSTSFIRLAFYPDDDVDTGDYPAQDSDFSATTAELRTITVSVKGVAHFGGMASYSTADGKVTACDISMSPNIIKNAHSYKATLTHEIGHCMHLAHNHADVDSIMSYNNRSTRHSLGVDDQIGLTFLYPSDDEYGKETPNLGMSCSRSQGVILSDQYPPENLD